LNIPQEARVEIPTWIFWSTRETINNDVPSLTAIIETFLAVPLYWWIAVEFETYFPLLVGVAVAPIVLLRSDESVALGVSWFVRWERYWVQDIDFDRIEISKQRLAWRVGLTLATVGSVLSCLLVWYYLGINFSDLISAGVPLFLASMLGAGIAVGAGVGNVSVAEKVAIAAAVVVSILASIGGGIVGAFAFNITEIGFLVILVIAAAAGGGAAIGAIAVILAIPIFLFGFAFGVLVISLAIRFVATSFYIPQGFRKLPRNFRRLTICTSPLQEPELVPDLPKSETQYSLSSVGRHLIRFASGFLSNQFTQEKVSSPIGIIIWPVATLLWFVPAWLYRITLKSTVWFWWPLAFFIGDLQRSKQPLRFYRKVVGTLWAKASIATAILAIGSFLITNLIFSGVVFQKNELLTVFGFFILADWSIKPWQILTIALSVLSVGIVFWLDDVVGDYQEAEEHNNVLLLKASTKKLGWIERLMRLRLVLAMLFWFTVGAHTLLYFNSLKCWFFLPHNVENWAIWIYGDRMPPEKCSKASSASWHITSKRTL
jgi:hypothetical protein